MTPSQIPDMQPDATRDSLDVFQQSVAGEEDPGASLDLDGSSSRHPQASDTGDKQTPPVSVAGAINPGDEAAPGTPGTGEDICRTCGGSGKLNGSDCPACGGSGKVTVGVGGG